MDMFRSPDVKGTATHMAHIDPVFNFRFWRISGQFCIKRGINDRTFHSAAVDTSFDTRFELNKCLCGPKEGRGAYVYFT